MKALILQPDRTAKVESIPVPEIDDDEVLVKVVAVALNPVDWIQIKLFGAAGTICGSDWSGVVVQTGRSVTSRIVGDHVAGYAQGANYTDRGAFAEYLKTGADLCWAAPAGTVTHEQAAAMGCGLWTAAQVLFHPDRLGLVEVPDKVDHEEWLFINGGSGSVGLYAIQLAHLVGYKIVTTASPRNHDLCKSLGADVVVDYKAPDAIAQIKAATNDTIRVALDAISEPDTQLFSVQVFGPRGGTLGTLLVATAAAASARADVTVRHTLIHTALGREFVLGEAVQGKMLTAADREITTRFFSSLPERDGVFVGAHRFPASASDRAHMVQFLAKTPALVVKGLIKPNPTLRLEGGLEEIHVGLKYMEEGKQSGQKIVYRIAD
ncbi:zinc-binding alcohol dehydrogenase family protein [Phanerochaete sordida]|uniref:Zinc-binding alcohol dehydrogenase family protein n=1 Tax=Phanerochaete sordida TaxID=48140 RepID=A0A9P3G8G1_9APHY|nr:zinc-binding alcohol dehydrogenase family protein [Phanerochaete sordida]